MNRIFAVLVIVSTILMLIFRPEGMLPAMSNAGSEAVALTLRLLAVYAVWTGLLRVFEETGAAAKVQKLLMPLIRLIFGKDVNREAASCISVNMTANMLGVGGAATPMGIKAIEHLGGNKEVRATMPMIMLFVINSSGLQLLPTTIIGIRQSAQSGNAGAVILPSVIVTLISFVLSVVLVRLCERIFSAKRQRGKK